jgi:small subunit ribosomal protein S20
MAHSNSAKKRIRQNVKHRSRNRWRLRTMRSALKEFNDRLIHGTYEETEAAYRKAAAILDKTASKGVIHRNHAARRKSRMAHKLKGMRQTAG